MSSSGDASALYLKKYKNKSSRILKNVDIMVETQYSEDDFSEGTDI